MLDFARWIVWQDDELIAVDKPAGVLSQGGEGGEGVNLVDLARAHLQRDGIGVLHRIDRNVSGLVLLARTPRAARAMSLAMQRGQIERVYRAVVRGTPREDALHVTAWLAKDAARNEVRACEPDALAALPPAARATFRPAETRARVMARFAAPLGPCAELEVRPVTGRSHQIRVHLAHVGLPIVGDPKYGVPARGLNRPLLHAWQLRFVHPVTRKPVALEAPVPWTEATLRALAPAGGAPPRP